MAVVAVTAATVTGHAARGQISDATRAALTAEYQANADTLAAAYADKALAKAVPIAARQAEILCALDGTSSRSCATGHNNHGSALAAAGRHEDAIAAFERAHAILKALPGDTDAEQIVPLRNMAANQSIIGDSEGQRNTLTTLLPLVEATEGPTSAAYAELLRAIAETWDPIGNRQEKLDALSRALTVQLAVKGEDDGDSIQMMQGVGILLSRSGRSEEARKLFLRAVPTAERHFGKNSSFYGGALQNLGNSERFLGNYPAAIDALRRAIAVFDAVGIDYPGNRQDALRSLAWIQEATGRSDEAEPILRRLIELAPPGSDQAYARLYLAENLLSRGEVVQARAILDTLLVDIFDGRNPIPPMLPGLIERQLARIAMLDANWAEVDRLMERSLSSTNIGLPKAFLATDIAIWADARARLGQRDKARQWFDAAVDMIAENNLHSTSEGIATKLAAAKFFLGEPDGGDRARTLLMQAYAAAELQRIDAPLDAGGQQALLLREAGYRSLYLTMADAWHQPGATISREGGHAIAFNALQRAMLGSATRAVALSAARRAAGEGDTRLSAVAGELQQVEDQMHYAERRLDAELTEPQRADERAAMAAELEALRTRRAALAAELETSFPDYFNLIRPANVGLPGIQQLLGESEALLLAVPAPDGVHVIAVTRTAAHWHKALVPQGKLETEIRRLLWFAGASVDGTAIEELTWQEEVPGTNAFDRTTAHRLHQLLIAPLLPTLRGKTHLFVTAGGALSRLPFSILVSAPPNGADDDAAALRDTRWMADDFALVHLPSVQTLYLQRTTARAAVAAPMPFAGIGDPALDGPPSLRAKRGAPAVSIAALRQLEQLPGTATELRAVSARYGKHAMLMLRSDASEPAIMAAPLDRFRIVSFATHALMAGEVGGAREAGLVLSPPGQPSASDDGYLAMSEIAALRLNADWVILSACNSAGGDGSVGATGLSGLARAFFHAGARNLLASHWPVLDAAAPPLIIDTLDPALQGDRATALQTAMRKMRQRDGFEESGNSYSHPRVWGPFVLIGDWR